MSSDQAASTDVGHLPAPDAAWPILSRILKETLRQPRALAITLALSLVGAVASLVLPRLIGRAVDQVSGLLETGRPLPETAREALLATATLVFLAALARGLLAMALNLSGERLSQRLALDLRLRLFAQIQKLSFSFHDQVHSGDLVTRGMIDLEGMRAFTHSILLQVLPLCVLIPLSAWFMISTDPLLALVALGFVPAAGWVLARSGLWLRRTWAAVQERMSRLTLLMEENLQGVRVVRAFSAEAAELWRFDEAAQSILSLQNRRITLRFAALSWMTLAYHASLGLLLWIGGRKVMSGALGAGDLAAFVAYLGILQGPTRQISMIFNHAARAAGAGERVYAILDEAPSVTERPDAKPLLVREGVLRFSNVSFRYRPDLPLALRGISFEVGPGRTLGVVGPPGSGKSTIALLCGRFYDADEGKITIDDVDIRDVTLASLRRQVGVVQQETFLFDAPIGHNLAYADPWASEETIRAASMAAQLHDQVERMAAGYETSVGERGVALSGGQRQRASIARGILPDPRILIFDDATSAVDAVTEEKIRNALAERGRDRATLIIAHRLSSLMHADEIIVLDQGAIVERGDHAALLRRGGLYAALHDLQSREAREGAAAAEGTVGQDMERVA